MIFECVIFDVPYTNVDNVPNGKVCIKMERFPFKWKVSIQMERFLFKWKCFYSNGNDSIKMEGLY